MLSVWILVGGMAVSVSGADGQKEQQRIIRDVKISGNVRIGDEVILGVMGIGKDRALPSAWPEESMEKLLSWYHRRGYFLARIDSIRTRISPDSQSVELGIWIFEGRQVEVGRVEILGWEGAGRRELARLLETRSGRIFDESVLEQDVEQILVFLENRGHPLSRVVIQSLSFRREEGDPKMDVVLRLEEGPPVRLDSVRIEGNRITREKVILRESRLKAGSLYRHGDVLSVREVLQRLGYFKEVAEPEVLFVEDRAVVTLKVEEGNTNTIDGVLGYNPAAMEGKKGYFTGRLQFTFKNLMGTGRFLEAYWEKKDEYSQAMRFGYEEPWLLGWPIHIGGRFQQEIRDTTYVERDWRFSARYTPWPSLSIRLEGGQKAILPDSMGTVLFNLAQTKSWLMAVGIDYNTFDDLLNPRKGVRYRTTLTMGRKRNVGPDFLLEQEGWKRVLNTRLIQVDAEGAFPTFGQQVLYFGLHGTEVRTGEPFVPLSDQIRFGGAQTLRGYREDAFRGTLVAWVNGEYRYLLGRHSRAFVFVDGGMYQRREKGLGLVKGAKVGFGIGIRIETRMGLIGIDYGLGEGDSLMRGKIHVGLVNRF